MSLLITVHYRSAALLSRQLNYLASFRTLQQQCRSASSTSPSPSETATRPSITPKPLSIPAKDYIPQPLNRPIGQSTPPQPGQNTGIDPRTWRQRRDDFFDYDKHLVRRRQLTQAVAKPYFREWTSISRAHKGKTFLAPRSLFKAEKALYFPNLHGYTLVDRWKVDKDTTDVLKGRVSIVGVYSGEWAQRQTESFVSETQDPDLLKLLREGVQKVEINMEETRGRAALVWLFAGGLRRARRREELGRYFVVRRGLTDEMKMEMGYVNGKVGYVYLVDWECRIRWAGSGEAEVGEKEGLVTGARRLMEARKREWEVKKDVKRVQPGEQVQRIVPSPPTGG